ncbi:helix-hairpin-helix domain-containing protein [Nocardioides sp.]|uniref:helix-hairpin-helix domain-containing protein n=1 Tax=Nocardioides sp. TaxID=35761 RepID=UPI003782FF35
MPTRRSTSEHQEAVSRRLALLSAELAGDRPDEAGWAEEHTRVRVPPGAPPPVPAPAPGPVSVPVPGRHAARRRTALAALVPEPLRGRIAVGPAQLTVVAVLVAAGLAATCWWVLRGSPERVGTPPVTPAPVALTSAAPPGDASPVAAGAGGTTGATDPSPAGTVTVDVTGKVRRPGIAVLDAGARVVDALEAAGGARRGVDLSSLNLARVLVDGEQVVVGVPAPPGVAAAAVPSAGASGGPLVDLNTATQAQLEALPEVGPVTAGAILAWRDAHGGFTAVDELLEVDGIGDATLSQLAPLVTV